MILRLSPSCFDLKVVLVGQIDLPLPPSFEFLQGLGSRHFPCVLLVDLFLLLLEDVLHDFLAMFFCGSDHLKLLRGVVSKFTIPATRRCYINRRWDSVAEEVLAGGDLVGYLLRLHHHHHGRGCHRWSHLLLGIRLGLDNRGCHEGLHRVALNLSCLRLLHLCCLFLQLAIMDSLCICRTRLNAEGTFLSTF